MEKNHTFINKKHVFMEINSIFGSESVNDAFSYGLPNSPEKLR